jgi:hypothetical protein
MAPTDLQAVNALRLALEEAENRVPGERRA